MTMTPTDTCSVFPGRRHEHGELAEILPTVARVEPVSPGAGTAGLRA